MITEDYVSFETAKLLKEKGFDGSCFYVWTKTENTVPSLLATANFVEGEIVTNRETLDAVARYHMNIYGLNNRVEGYLCPSIAMTMKWLRLEHNIHIEPHIVRTKCSYGYMPNYIDLKELKQHFPFYEFDFNNADKYVCITYDKACEVTLKYCLENLI